MSAIYIYWECSERVMMQGSFTLSRPSPTVPMNLDVVTTALRIFVVWKY